jgi:hypothetical protein
MDKHLGNNIKHVKRVFLSNGDNLFLVDSLRPSTWLIQIASTYEDLEVLLRTNWKVDTSDKRDLTSSFQVKMPKSLLILVLNKMGNGCIS